MWAENAFSRFVAGFAPNTKYFPRLETLCFIVEREIGNFYGEEYDDRKYRTQNTGILCNIRQHIVARMAARRTYISERDRSREVIEEELKDLQDVRVYDAPEIGPRLNIGARELQILERELQSQIGKFWQGEGAPK